MAQFLKNLRQLHELRSHKLSDRTRVRFVGLPSSEIMISIDTCVGTKICFFLVMDAESCTRGRIVYEDIKMGDARVQKRKSWLTLRIEPVVLPELLFLFILITAPFLG